jgi:hypothetical protein
MRTLALPAAAMLAGCLSKPEPPALVGGDARADARADARLITGGTRRLVTLNEVPGQPLTRFPVSVLMQGDADLAARAPARENIAFTTMVGEPLPCEIVVAANGTLEAWVQLPVFDASMRTFLLVYGSDVESPCDRPSVWQDYRAAWHFTDGTPGVAKDSARDIALFQRNGFPVEGTGRIGQGLSFYQADTNGADVMCALDEDALDFGETSFSIEAWVFSGGFVNIADTLLEKRGSSRDAGYDLDVGGNPWVSSLRDGTTTTSAVFNNDPSASSSRWSHILSVVDRGTGSLQVYFNGVAALGQPQPLTVGSVDSNHDLCLGDSTTPMRAYVDEVRLHGEARPADWARASMRNVVMRDAFMTVAVPPP